MHPFSLRFLVRAEDEEPTVKKSGAQDEEVFMMQHTKVFAVKAEKARVFSVEAFCQLEQVHNCNMADHKVHLVVEKVAADDQGKNITVLAEKSSSSTPMSRKQSDTASVDCK